MKVEVWGGVNDGRMLTVPDLIPEVRLPRHPHFGYEARAEPDADGVLPYDEFRLCWRLRGGKLRIPVYVPAPIAKRLHA